MFRNPLPDAGFAEIVARFLAFNPLVAIGLFDAVAEYAFGHDVGNSVPRSHAAGGRVLPRPGHTVLN